MSSPSDELAVSGEIFPSRRFVNFLAFLACAGLLGYGYYLETYQGLEPCPLCLLQRYVFVVLGVLFLLAALHNPSTWGSKVYGILLFLIAAVGIGLSGYHVWLQNLPPDQVPECGPSLEYMLESFPLLDALKMTLNASGQCAEVTWRFIGLSIPAWTCIMFILLGLAALIHNWRHPESQ